MICGSGIYVFLEENATFNPAANSFVVHPINVGEYDTLPARRPGYN